MTFLGKVKGILFRLHRALTAGGLVFYLSDLPLYAREFRGVLYGKSLFDGARLAGGKTNSLLRRNIHRIEKGLVMRPRRPVFALDYIEETIVFLEGYIARINDVGGSFCPDAVWAHDVLSEYFRVTAGSELIGQMNARFRRIPFPAFVGGNGAKEIPFLRSTDSRTVDYSDLVKLSWARRSCRWFLSRPVPRDLIEAAMEVARQSPSACNRQPFYFHVFDDAEKTKAVSSLPMGVSGFGHQFPAIIAVVGELRHYGRERDRHIIYIDASLAAMAFVFAAETLGLGTCCINWPDVEERESKAADLLGLEPDQRIVMFIAIGYPDPDGLVPRSTKRSVSELLKYN